MESIAMNTGVTMHKPTGIYNLTKEEPASTAAPRLSDEEQHRRPLEYNVSDYQTDAAYQNLADSIVLQAAIDYRLALRRYARGKESYAGAILSLRRFFSSAWCYQLSAVAGKTIVERIDKEFPELSDFLSSLPPIKEF